MLTSEKWHATAGFKLLWHTWDDESVVYHTGSGDTHLLDSVAAFVLKTLEKKTLNIFEIIETLSQDSDLVTDENFHEFISQLISKFNRLGLIERHSG